VRPEVVGRAEGARRAEGPVVAAHALVRHAGEAALAEEPVGVVAHPDVEVPGDVPGVVAPTGGGQHPGLVAGPPGDRGLGAGDAGGDRAPRSAHGQGELDPGVGGDPGERGGDAPGIRVQPPEVGVEHVDLRVDLGVADVLGGGVPDDVHDDGDADDPGPRPLLTEGGDPLLDVFLDLLAAPAVLGVEAHELAVLLHRPAAVSAPTLARVLRVEVGGHCGEAGVEGDARVATDGIGEGHGVLLGWVVMRGCSPKRSAAPPSLIPSGRGCRGAPWVPTMRSPWDGIRRS
jgi:hypothetical protein